MCEACGSPTSGKICNECWSIVTGGYICTNIFSSARVARIAKALKDNNLTMPPYIKGLITKHIEIAEEESIPSILNDPRDV